ncbi:MAG: N-acetylmuramoyl-L-alanine amidase [Acidobacteria bacterium]|nr:N-acetylmuramoyl-L-alanine amidase [Acidobacteriota bacterium]
MRFRAGFLLSVVLCAAPATVGAAVQRVVIDPGHGGAEDGAIGPSGLKEKDLVLDIARRLSAALAADGVDVTLTRDGDEDVALDTRASIANERRAELFISLHVNASRHNGARGAETFFLAPEATDDAARTTAALENDAAGAGVPAAAGADLPLILWDLAQVEYLHESARLARAIQDRLNSALGITDRGVRQAPFRVLVGATCPAVLVELGFLTNPEEEAKLADGEYRRKLVEALLGAVRDFPGSSR